MQPFSKALQCSLVAALALPLCAQDLAPRAYVITPVCSNAATFTYSFYDGGVNFNGAVPVTNATGTFSAPVFSLYHSFSFFGRSANNYNNLAFGWQYSWIGLPIKKSKLAVGAASPE